MGNAFPIPLNALRAIEIVARAGSLAPAAEELGVTVGAVSQHLRRAEERLGMELFIRTPQGLRPVPELIDILPQLSSGFAQLRDGLALLTGAHDTVLNITVGSVFASRWLIWRINKFSSLNKGLEVRLAVTADMLDLNRADVDCAIRFGHRNWPGVKASLIGGQAFQPVCSPEFLADHPDLSDLSRVPVIMDETTMLDWSQWLAASGRDPATRLSGPVFSDASLAFDAAISGLGLLLAADMMSADPVCDNRLLRPFDLPVSGRHGYYLATAESRREPRKVQLFRQWLDAEVPQSAGGYLAQLGRAP
jgi:DNA-binding transcriptional LysR family regulator